MFIENCSSYVNILFEICQVSAPPPTPPPNKSPKCSIWASHQVMNLKLLFLSGRIYMDLYVSLDPDSDTIWLCEQKSLFSLYYWDNC